ncbi:MAG: helix-turn-helix domain-containing protein [Oscillospiraceae bacterium]|nr:helix-turn-helix domain-containing protein [Oscillospiraceae bacterium]
MILSTDELADSLCKNLKQVRNIADISVKELSEYLGLSRQTINNFESGRVVLMYSHVIAILAILDYKLKTNSPKWYAIQKILDISLPKLGANSFLAYWFRLREIYLSSSENDNILFSLYDTLINEKLKVNTIAISEFVSISDKIYLFADSLMQKGCLPFLDILTEHIADVRKTLPIVILRTHLQSILERKTKETEIHVVALYKKLNQLKEKSFIVIEEASYNQENFCSDFSNISSIAHTQNLFVSVITENKDVLGQFTKNIGIFCIASFDDELEERRQNYEDRC